MDREKKERAAMLYHGLEIKMFKVTNLKLFPVLPHAPELQGFEIRVDGKPTRCVANYETKDFFVHFRAGRLKLSLEDYDNADVDLMGFIEAALNSDHAS